MMRDTVMRQAAFAKLPRKPLQVWTWWMYEDDIAWSPPDNEKVQCIATRYCFSYAQPWFGRIHRSQVKTAGVPPE